VKSRSAEVDPLVTDLTGLYKILLMYFVYFIETVLESYLYCKVVAFIREINYFD